MTTRKPLLILDGESGRRCISVLEFDADGNGVRVHVLSSERGDGGVADRIMQSRFDHMAQLMGDNVETDIRFSTEDEAETEAEARNAEEEGPITWQTAYVHDGDAGACILTEADILAGRDDDCTLHDHEDSGYWIVVADAEDYGSGRDTPSPENAWGG